MTRLVDATNRADGLRRLAEGPEPAVRAVDLVGALGGSFDPDTVLVVGGEASPALVEPHRRAENLVVVTAASRDVAMGQRGALAGLGRPWSVRAGTLADLELPTGVDEAEVRWRLWNDGVVVVPVPGAPVIDHEPSGLAGDLVPLEGVRPTARSQATVPTISWVIHGPVDLAIVLGRIDRGPAVPDEVLVVGDPGVRPGRVRGVADVEEAVATAEGAVVWFLGGRADPGREALHRMWRRFADERVEVVRTAYAAEDGPIRSSAGLDDADGGGVPWCAAVRRRVLRKPRTTVEEAWRSAVDRERVALVVSDPVPVPVVGARRLPGAGDLASLEARDVARVVRPAERDPSVGAPTVPTVAYVGFSGYANFGDELVLEAARRLLPGLDVQPKASTADAVVLGGGTLLNADGFFLRIVDQVLRPGQPRLVLGTGVVSPEVGGWTEDLARWRPFLAGAGVVGVRGPHSLADLRAWGWEGPAEVLGDPGLAVEVPRMPDPGRVVVAPIGASAVGQVSDDDERHQVGLLAEAIERWRAEGRAVTLLSAHPGDDRIVVDLMRRTGRTDLHHVAGHRDLVGAIEAIGAAELVVGARLHTLVAAAAGGVPFLGLAYRPKLGDFAASVDAEDWVRPLPAWEPEALAVPDRAAIERMGAAVDELRGRLAERSAGFVDEVRASFAQT